VHSDDGDEAIIRAVNRHSGAGLRRVGRADQGTLGGAICVEWPDGRPGVVTRFLGSMAAARRTAEVLDDVRGRGLPVPRHDLVVEVDDTVVMVQERLPGSPAGRATIEVIDAMIALNDRLADLLIDRQDVPILPLCLDRSGDPYPRHEVLAQHSNRSRRILEAIRELAGRGPRAMVGDDLVHIDLTPDNVLFADDGTVTGLVDWNLGIYRGDRHLALVKTRFDLEWSLHARDPAERNVGAAVRLDAVLAQRVAPATLRAYWAHRVLYQLHWALQFAPAEVVEWHLEVAEARLL
jgi:aminoglycoside phosphotransferase (APT) family kinase protein